MYVYNDRKIPANMNRLFYRQFSLKIRFQLDRRTTSRYQNIFSLNITWQTAILVRVALEKKVAPADLVIDSYSVTSI